MTPFSQELESLEIPGRFNIDQLDEAELRDLNHRIVERLRFLQMRAHAAMLNACDE
jgi:hypothetical protein